LSTFSVSGLISGIDYNAMIEQIIELERKPISLQESRQEAFKTKVSKYGELSSKLDALKTAAEGLKTGTDFYARSAEAADETVFNATAGSSASEGNYAIEVIRLAQAHRIASTPVAAETSTVASGAGSFSFQVGAGEPVTVAVTAATTLVELAGAINTATDDAEASVINDGTGYRLVLKSAASGAGNAITVTANATSLGLPTGPVSGGVQLQAAQDASFTIDDLAMTRSTNSVEGAISGVAITLKNVGESTLSISNDTGAIQEKIESFVTAYNEVVTLISSNTAYNSDTGTGSAFTGESTARDIVTRLQSILGTRVAGLPETLRSLSQIGIKTEKDGTLTVDSSVLTDKIASDLDGVSDLFNAEGGVAGSVYDYLDGVTDSISGSIAYRTKNLSTLVSKISDDIDQAEARLAEREEDLIQQFAKLESILSSYSTQASYLAGLLSTSSTT
jgi:flagellar hook-associated protein 2